MASNKGVTYICKSGSDKNHTVAIVRHYNSSDIIGHMKKSCEWSGYVYDPTKPEQDYNIPYGANIEGQLFESLIGPGTPEHSAAKIFSIQWMIDPEAASLGDKIPSKDYFAGYRCGWAVRDVQQSVINEKNRQMRKEDPKSKLLIRDPVIVPVYRGDWEHIPPNDPVTGKIVQRMYWISNDPQAEWLKNDPPTLRMRADAAKAAAIKLGSKNLPQPTGATQGSVSTKPGPIPASWETFGRESQHVSSRTTSIQPQFAAIQREEGDFQAAEQLDLEQDPPRGSQLDVDESGRGQPDVDEPEGGQPDGGEPEGGQPDGGEPEGGQPDGGEPEGGHAAGSQPEEAPDTTEPEPTYNSEDEHLYAGLLNEFGAESQNAPLTAKALCEEWGIIAIDDAEYERRFGMKYEPAK